MTVKPIPEGYHSVTPYLIISGAAAALDFYKKAFGATELFRMPMPDRQIGYKAPKSLGGTTTGIMLYVEDVDAIAKQAVAAGAKEVRPVVDQFYGDRSGTFVDPFGHVWTIGTHKEDLSSEEMQRRVSQQNH